MLPWSLLLASWQHPRLEVTLTLTGGSMITSPSSCVHHSATQYHPHVPSWNHGYQVWGAHAQNVCSYPLWPSSAALRAPLDNNSIAPCRLLAAPVASASCVCQWRDHQPLHPTHLVQSNQVAPRPPCEAPTWETEPSLCYLPPSIRAT